MKLVVQIPCLNEEATLPLVLRDIPKSIPGVDEIIVLVINDGSDDKTVEVAKAHGVKHFVQHAGRRGLGRSFHDGVVAALEMGADILVNTDGDNQYPQQRITDLVTPIVNGEADIVIADRQTKTIEHFSPFKKLLQAFGSKIVNIAAGTDLPDAASGFRAYSRESLMQLNTITKFSYAMETIIQAGNKQLKIVSLPVQTNAKLRESRLFKSIGEHVFRSSMAIIRAYIMYKPYVMFNALAVILLIAGAIPFLRYLIIYLSSGDGSHIQSLIAGAVALIGAFFSIALGILADLTRSNRVLLENTLEHLKQTRFRQSNGTTLQNIELTSELSSEQIKASRR